MSKYVFYEESPLNNGMYLLRINHELFPFHRGTSGSYDVILARIAGLSYPDFLRMCRDLGGAQLNGKNTLYPVAYFKFNEGLFAITKWLNARAKWLIYRHEHPYEFEIKGEEIIKIFDKEVSE